MAIAGRMEGWIALVTGASSGIGLALARECARQGAWVALAARRSDRLKELKREIEKMGGMAMICTCDVTDAAQVNRTVKRVVNQWGGLDLVVANAGFSVTGSFENLSVDDYRRQFETNVFGVIHTVKASMPHLIESEGRLGIMSSIAGFIGYPGASAYCASKFAVIALTQAGARAFAEHGITVNAFCPGVVRTELWEQLDKEFMAQGLFEKPGDAMAEFAKRILLGRTSTPDDIVGLAAFLASDDSDYITGQSIMVDGGMVLW